MTGLTSAMYVDESNPAFPEIDATNAESKTSEALAQSGLYIKNRNGDLIQVSTFFSSGR
jgi:hypothetical protein